MDCLYCDRCRYQPITAVKKEPAIGGRPPYAPMNLLSRYFVVGVLAAATLVSMVSISRFLQVIPAGFGQTAVSVSSGGEPRDVDLQRVRTMIKQKRLSYHEAEFYSKEETSYRWVWMTGAAVVIAAAGGWLYLRRKRYAELEG